MNILIDATSTQDQLSTRGIGVTTRRIIKELVELSSTSDAKDTYWLLLFNSPTTLADTIQKHSDIVKTVNIGTARTAGKFDFIWWRLSYLPAIRRICREQKIDLYYAPYFLRGIPVGKLPIAAMVYDFAFPVLGRYSTAPVYLDWIRKFQYHRALNKLNRVDAVAAISDKTRKDFYRFLPKFPKERARTVYLGLPDELRPKEPKRSVLRKYLKQDVFDRGYILYYGGIEINKNVPGLLRSYSALRKLWSEVGTGDDQPPYLVLAGGDFTRLDLGNRVLREIRDFIVEEGLENEVHFTGYYEDEHVGDIINGAKLFVHLSLYEGFGFSPLEAMKCGVPVVASDRSCYPEVLGDGAILVDPEDPNAVARGCLSLLMSEHDRQRQIERGLERASLYDWKKTGRELYEMFLSVNNVEDARKST